MAKPNPSSPLSAILPLTIPALIALLIITGSFYSFDSTDEGIFLYHLIAGEKANFMSFYQLLLHPLGELFGHHLLIYRFMQLLFTITSASWLAHAALSWLDPKHELTPLQRNYFTALVLSGAMAYAAFILTPNYHQFATMGGYLWLGAIFYYGSGKLKATEAMIAVGVGGFLAFAGRPPFGALLALATLILVPYLSSYPTKKTLLHLATAAATASAAFALLYIIYPTAVNRAFTLASLVRESQLYSEGSVLKTLYRDLRILTKHQLTLTLLLLSAAIIILIKKRGLHWPRWFLLAGAMYFSVPHFNVSWVLLSPLLAVTCFAVFFPAAFLSPKGNADLLWRKRALFASCLAMATAFFTSLGTETDMIGRLSYSFAHGGLIFGILAWPTPNKGNRLQAAWSLFIALWIAVTIYDGRFTRPYRNSPAASMIRVGAAAPVLTGIKIPPDNAHLIQAISKAAAEAGFDRTQDRLIPYANLPGFVAAVGAKAFGMAGYHRGRPQSDPFNCLWLSTRYREPLRNVYLLRYKALSPILRSCLSEYILGLNAPPLYHKQLGSYDIYGRNEPYTFIFEGPYPAKPSLFSGP